MAAFEVIALDTATPQLRAPGASDTYTFPRAVEMPLGTANGVLFLNGSKVVTSGSGLTFDSSGNLGLATTPSAWGGGYKSYTNQTYGEYYSNNGGVVGLAANAYNDGTNWVYKISTNASRYEQALSFGHQWYTAPSGTAGNAISFTQAMTLDASGRLLIGTTTAGIGNNNATALSIANGTANVYQSIRASGGEELYLYAASGSAGLYAYSNNPLIFGTNNTERLRLKSTGQLRYVPLSSDPAGAEAGDVYYNSGTNKLRLYDGSTWVDLN